MTGATAHWLAGRRGFVVGEGEASSTVAAALADAGALVERLPQPPVEAPDIAQVFAAAAERLGGPVDLLVHSGVAMPVSSAEAIDLALWRATLSADLDGRFLFAAEFTRRLLADSQGGAILFLMPSSAATAGRSASATADGALANLVKSLAVEWGRDGIRINAIRSRACEPGGLTDESVRSSLGHLAAYLMSDYGAYITGCLMGIDEI